MMTHAFVLGAGLGTRLRPLTDALPKPLIPIFQKPLITFALDHLRDAGVKSFVINTHHLAAQFESLFAKGLYHGHPVRLVHEPDLLGTGGGIKNAETWLGTEPFIVYSGDLLTDIDMEPLIEEHFRAGNDVTLALRETGLASGVVFRNGHILEIRNKEHPGDYDFANISIWNPEIFERIPPGKKISFIPILVEWIRQNGKIGGVVANDRRWFNIGSRAEYLAVHRLIIEQSWRPDYVKAPEWPVQVARDASVAANARLSGFYSIGAGAHVGEGAVLENTILWRGAQIASRSHLRNCIVRCHQRAEGEISDTDI